MAVTACKECKKEVSNRAKKCPHCGISNPGVTGKDYLIGAAILGALIVFVPKVCSSSSSSSPPQQSADANANPAAPDTSEYTAYEVLEVDTSSPRKATYNLLVGTDGKKPTKDMLLQLAKKYRAQNMDKERVFVGFLLPGMDPGMGSYATGHSDPETSVKILGFEPKEWCHGELTYWAPQMGLCVHGDSEKDYQDGTRTASEYLSLVSATGQEQYEGGLKILSGAQYDGKYQDAITALEKAASGGHYAAIEELADIYRESVDTPLSNSAEELSKVYGKHELKSKAQRWFKKAIEVRTEMAGNGHIDSILKLVEFYQFGQGSPINNKKCLGLLKTAMDLKSDEAYFEMGMAYKEGYFGLKRDATKAIHYYEEAKKLGNSLADTHLADLTENGLSEDGWVQEEEIEDSSALKELQKDVKALFEELKVVSKSKAMLECGFGACGPAWPRKVQAKEKHYRALVDEKKLRRARGDAFHELYQLGFAFISPAQGKPVDTHLVYQYKVMLEESSGVKLGKIDTDIAPFFQRF